jgi:hypothetical protein
MGHFHTGNLYHTSYCIEMESNNFHVKLRLFFLLVETPKCVATRKRVRGGKYAYRLGSANLAEPRDRHVIVFFLGSKVQDVLRIEPPRCRRCCTSARPHRLEY